MNERRRLNEELLKRIKNSDNNIDNNPNNYNDAKDKLIELNIGLVHSVVKRFVGRGHELEDLFQIGCIGLIKAVDRFDMSFGVAFSTYAVPMIIGEIKRFIRDDGIIKVSRAYKDISAKAAAIREKIISETGTEPSVCVIADELGISPQELASALEAVTKPESIFAAMDDGNSQTLSIADKLESQENYQEQIENKLMLSEALNGINEREKMIIYMRYFKNKTQSEIGEILGVSQVQVSRIEKRVLLKMREKLTG